MKRYVINEIEYELIEDNGDCFNEIEVKDKVTDYFDEFDYILGDYAYNKLRLKGFCDRNNTRYNKINDFKTKDTYIKNLCAYKCRYFVLKKVKKGRNHIIL